jgi:hypothetical protein
VAAGTIQIVLLTSSEEESALLAQGPFDGRVYASLLVRSQTGLKDRTVKVVGTELIDVDTVPLPTRLWSTTLGPLGTSPSRSVFFQGQTYDVGGPDVVRIVSVGEPSPGFVVLAAQLVDGTLALFRWSAQIRGAGDPWSLFALIPEHTEAHWLFPVPEGSGPGVFIVTEAGWSIFTPRFGLCDATTPLQKVEFAVSLRNGLYFLAGPAGDGSGKYLGLWLSPK